MTWIEELQQFSSNGGQYHKGVGSQWGGNPIMRL